jgi:hypothetical protein
MFLKYYIILKSLLLKREITMNKEHPLIRALKINAVFSGVSALLLFAAAGWLAAELGLADATPVYIVAALLTVFAIQLIAIVRSRKIRFPEVAAIIGGDIAWVVASIVLVALYYESITTTGLMLIDVISIAVLTFAVLQIRGLRAYRREA